MSDLSEQTMQKFTDDLIDCEQKSIAYPNLTEIYPKGTVSQAYMVQQIFINKLAKSGVLGEIIGYKAALTARPAQEAMNIEDTQDARRPATTVPEYHNNERAHHSCAMELCSCPGTTCYLSRNSISK